MMKRGFTTRAHAKKKAAGDPGKPSNSGWCGMVGEWVVGWRASGFLTTILVGS